LDVRSWREPPRPARRLSKIRAAAPCGV